MRIRLVCRAGKDPVPDPFVADRCVRHVLRSPLSAHFSAQTIPIISFKKKFIFFSKKKKFRFTVEFGNQNHYFQCSKSPPKKRFQGVFQSRGNAGAPRTYLLGTTNPITTSPNTAIQTLTSQSCNFTANKKHFYPKKTPIISP